MRKFIIVFQSIAIVIIFITSMVLAADKWVVYTAQNSGMTESSTWAIAKDGHGTMWFGTRKYPNSGGGLVKFDGTNWSIYDVSNSQVPSNAVWTIAVDHDDNLWLGTFDDGAAKFYPETETFEVYNTANSDLPDNEAEFIVVDNDNNPWFATDGGLARFDGAKWDVFTYKNSGLPDEDPSDDEANEVECIYVNKDNTLWVTTDDGGVTLCDPLKKEWKVYNRKNSNIPSNLVECVNVDSRGTIWFGTMRREESKGAVKFDGNTTWKVYNKNNSGLEHNDVEAIDFDTDDNVWFGTYGGGVSFLDIKTDTWKTFRKSNSPLPNDNVFAVLVDSDNSVWFGTEGGVAHYYPDGTALISHVNVNTTLFSCAIEGGSIVLEYSGTKHAETVLYDLSGRLITQVDFSKAGVKKIGVGRYGKGMFLLHIKRGNRNEIRKILFD